MKATITEDGTLLVRAENELESYALDRWADDYFGKEGTAQRKSVLMIQPTVDRAAAQGAAGQG